MLKNRDGDDLWDDEELRMGTNPFYYDTDFDLLSDKDDPEPLTPLYISVIVDDLEMRRDVIVELDNGLKMAVSDTHYPHFI